MRNIVYVLGALMLFWAWGVGSLEAAQDNPPPDGGAAGGGAGNGGGRRGGWDPEAMRQRMLDRAKETLGSTDEEWKALQPKVEAVQKLVMQSRMGMFGRRRGGNTDPNQPQPQPEATTDVQKLTQELQALLDNKDADPKVVAEKLKALREARDKSKVDLKKAQDELRELLTPLQEARLVMMGLLE
jgi:hypothetical protein